MKSTGLVWLPVSPCTFDAARSPTAKPHYKGAWLWQKCRGQCLLARIFIFVSSEEPQLSLGGPNQGLMAARLGSGSHQNPTRGKPKLR